MTDKRKHIDKPKFMDGDAAAARIMQTIVDHHIPHTPRGESVEITCPYHPTESGMYPDPVYHRLSINLVPKYKNGRYIAVGVFHCWSCNKSGHFNQLIDDVNLPPKKLLKVEALPIAGSIEDNRLFSVEHSQVQELPYEGLSKYEVDAWHGSWRGITEDTLLRMGALCYFDYNPRLDRGAAYATERLLFLCHDIEGEEIGWIALASEAERKNNPKCIKQKNSKGSWARRTLLFHEQWKDTRYVVLVEGPFDALRLIQEGIQACAMLGAGNWSDEKRDLLSGKFDNVIILFDGDDTGYTDADIVEESLQDYVEVLNMRLPILPEKKDQLDPGNMPDKYVNVLKKKINKFTGEPVFELPRKETE